tara:strand:- start:246 stop:422 length:177 start_codon:yes stop_codon:yes gene_type:complete
MPKPIEDIKDDINDVIIKLNKIEKDLIELKELQKEIKDFMEIQFVAECITPVKKGWFF